MVIVGVFFVHEGGSNAPCPPEQGSQFSPAIFTHFAMSTLSTNAVPQGEVKVGPQKSHQGGDV